MNYTDATTRGIVASMGNWWIAVLRSFGIMSQSVHSSMTSERRLSGEPTYHGDEGDAESQSAVSNDDTDEWRQSGGVRIVASKIMKHAAKIIGADWSAVTLALHDDPIDRGLAEAGLGRRISKQTGWPRVYCQYVCKRWGEDRFKDRHKGAVSREYRIEYTHTVAELIEYSGFANQKERQIRDEICMIIDNAFNTAKGRLERS